MRPNPRPVPHRLRLWLAFASLGLVLTGGWVIWASRAPAEPSGGIIGGPRLQVETNRIDHGTVKLGVPINDSIRITNTGDQPLRFTEEPYLEVAKGC